MPPALGDEPVDAVEPPIHDGIAIVGSLLQGFSPHEAQNAIELIAGWSRERCRAMGFGAMGFGARGFGAGLRLSPMHSMFVSSIVLKATRSA